MSAEFYTLWLWSGAGILAGLAHIFLPQAPMPRRAFSRELSRCPTCKRHNLVEKKS